MFDINKVGKKISELRRKNGLTQSQLADKLYVSYQAISNWERGLSMPDVGKLQDLVNILNSNIDELVGENGENKIFKAVLEKNYNEEEVKTFDVDSLCNASAFLAQETIEHLLTKLDKNVFKIKHAICMAPYVKTSLIYYILDNIKDDSIDINYLIELAPFIDKEKLDELIKKYKIENNDNLILIGGLAPFISQDSLESLLENVKTIDKVMDLVAIAPFVSSDTLFKLSFKLEEIDSFKNLMHLAPFLTSEQFNQIIKNAKDEE